MSKLKKFASVLLVLVMCLTMTTTAFAADDDTGTGTITITNATIDQTYRVYKLFDATYGNSYTDDNGNTVIPTAYVATKAQKEALEAETDNVFEFTALSDGTYYQVTVKSGVTDAEVIAFIQSYVLAMGSTVYVCTFPGATEAAAVTASDSTVTIGDLAYGYYFVTSSLGSVVSLNTTNPTAKIVDKNTSTPDWDNNPDEPEPDDPVKDVLNEEGTRSINEEKVAVGDVLTYSISYTNTAYDDDADAGVTLSKVEIYDAAPDGTTYKTSSIAIQVLNASGVDVTADFVTDTDDTATDGTLTWTVDGLLYEYTVVATFQVTVDDDAIYLVDSTIVNDADLDVTLGEHTYKLKTNTVKNPVDEEPEEPNEPVKDVKDGTDGVDVTSGSIDGEQVEVGDILTYTITYTNTEDAAVDLTIKDAPPTGTVYVADSAGSTLSDDQVTITVGTDGTITWFVDDLAVNATVIVYFQVEVTDVALSITDNTVTNSAEYKFEGENFYTTNTVKNPTEPPDEPDEPNKPGKVIVNADGTETKVSTGAIGDTVTFDVSIDAVNLVEEEDAGEESDDNPYNDQVAYYYIYDQMDPGFTLNDESFTLTINDQTIEVKYVETKANGVKYYTIGDGYDDSFLFTYMDANGYTIIEAKITWADANGNGLYPNCEIHLTYTATINDNAIIAGVGNYNRAIYDYSVVNASEPNEPDPEKPEYPSGSDLNHDVSEIETVTYTYALGIYKVSAETGEALSGAKFTFVDAGGNTIYGVETEVAGVYIYSSSTATDATDTFVSNSEGQIIIKGVDIGTYTLTEVKAPSGYTLLTDPVRLTAQMDSSAEAKNTYTLITTRNFEAITADEFEDYTGTVYTKDADGMFVETTKPAAYTDGLYKMVSSSTSSSESGKTVVTTFEIAVASVMVENQAGTVLPSTGGIGTTIFYIVGGVLVCGAAVLLITRKRMEKR